MCNKQTSKPSCLAVSHTTSQHPGHQAAGQRGAIRSAGLVFVYCLRCTHERAGGHQPSDSRHASIGPPKAMPCRPRERDLPDACSLQFVQGLGRAVQPQDQPVAGGAGCPPHVAAGAAGVGTASRTEAQAMADLRHHGQGEFQEKMK